MLAALQEKDCMHPVNEMSEPTSSGDRLYKKNHYYTNVNYENVNKSS